MDYQNNPGNPYNHAPNPVPPNPNNPPPPNWSTNPPPPNWSTNPPPNRGATPPPNPGATPPPPNWSTNPPPNSGATPPPRWTPPNPGNIPPRNPGYPPPNGWRAPSRLDQYAAGRKELIFALFAMICSLLVCNFTLFGGFNLGFGIAMSGYILCGALYILSSGGRFTPYSAALLVLSLVITAGFGRSDDGGMKFVMVLFLFLAVNLCFCTVAGQNIFRVGSVRSIGDVFRSIFILGFGQMGPAIGGLFGGMKGKGSLGKKIGAVLLGLLITVPLIGIVLPLLVEADAAFEAMMEVLPEIDLGEAMVTVIFGVGVFIFLYSRCVGQVRRPKSEPVDTINLRGINALTVNTVLCGICLVYLLYLFSQLAYFVSGFAGMVPKGYTFAEYARRGFFEMAWLCVINMTIIVLTSLLVRKNEGGTVPTSSRILCLFIGLFTVFLVMAASAKMFVYIGGYGLTRKRVMTQLLIVFFGVAALTMALSLFVRKPRYMQVLVITALLLGGTAFWADVDTVVATYNVNAYLEGDLETVDVEYLGDLSDGAIPQIARLVNDEDEDVAKEARRILRRRDADWEDFREWNYARGQAAGCLKQDGLPDEDDDDFWSKFYDEDDDDYRDY